MTNSRSRVFAFLAAAAMYGCQITGPRPGSPDPGPLLQDTTHFSDSTWKAMGLDAFLASDKLVGDYAPLRKGNKWKYRTREISCCKILAGGIPSHPDTLDKTIEMGIDRDSIFMTPSGMNRRFGLYRITSWSEKDSAGASRTVSDTAFEFPDDFGLPNLKSLLETGLPGDFSLPVPGPIFLYHRFGPKMDWSDTVGAYLSTTIRSVQIVSGSVDGVREPVLRIARYRTSGWMAGQSAQYDTLQYAPDLGLISESGRAGGSPLVLGGTSSSFTLGLESFSPGL